MDIDRPQDAGLDGLAEELRLSLLQVADLAATVEAMRQRLETLEHRDATGESSAEMELTRSRRDLLRLAGAAMIGGAAGAALNVLPAAAATNDNMVLGHANDANATTSMTATAASTPVPILFVRAAAASAAFPGVGPLQSNGASGADGIDGFAPGTTGFGVVGSSDSGHGVVGFTSTGIDVYASGTGRLLQRSNSSPLGPGQQPNYAANSFEQVRDPAGLLWISGIGGTWRRVNSLRVDSSTGDGTSFIPVRVINTDPAIGPVVGGVSGPLANNTTTTWQIAGSNGIPVDAVGIVGNITAVAYTSGGFMTMFPAGVARPVVSSVNFGLAGQVFAWGNHFTVGFGTGANGGKISISTGLNSGTDTSHVVVDVFGFIQ